MSLGAVEVESKRPVGGLEEFVDGVEGSRDPIQSWKDLSEQNKLIIAAQEPALFDRMEQMIEAYNQTYDAIVFMLETFKRNGYECSFQIPPRI